MKINCSGAVGRVRLPASLPHGLLEGRVASGRYAASNPATHAASFAASDVIPTSACVPERLVPCARPCHSAASRGLFLALLLTLLPGALLFAQDSAPKPDACLVVRVEQSTISPPDASGPPATTDISAVFASDWQETDRIGKLFQALDELTASQLNSEDAAQKAVKLLGEAEGHADDDILQIAIGSNLSSSQTNILDPLIKATRFKIPPDDMDKGVFSSDLYDCSQQLLTSWYRVARTMNKLRPLGDIYKAFQAGGKSYYRGFDLMLQAYWDVRPTPIVSEFKTAGGADVQLTLPHGTKITAPKTLTILLTQALMDQLKQGSAADPITLTLPVGTTMTVPDGVVVVQGPPIQLPAGTTLTLTSETTLTVSGQQANLPAGTLITLPAAAYLNLPAGTKSKPPVDTFTQALLDMELLRTLYSVDPTQVSKLVYSLVTK